MHQTFAALGNATRFAIVERLLRDGELAASDLLAGQDISAPAVSRHIKILREAGIVSQRVDKQRRMYAVRPQAVRQINDWAISYRDFWGASFDRLASELAKTGQR